MFLFERLFGIGVYMLVLLFACLFLIKTNASCKSVLRGYLVCLCIMAYLYKPYITGDLYRIFETMDYFSTIGFEPFWNDFVLESSVPVARLIYWAVGKTGINALLPMLSALTCYSLIFYIINKTKEMYSVSNTNVAYVLFFVMINSVYISVIGGIRMMLALCMISFSYFRGKVLKKFGLIDILFYVLSIFIHAMSYAVIGMCIMVSLIDSDKKIIRRISYVLVAGVGGLFFLMNFSNTVSRLYQKFLDYVLGDKHSDSWEYIMGGLIIGVLLMLLYEFRQIRNDDNYKKLNLYNSAIIGCVIIAFCFCFEFSIFYRFGGQLAVLLSIPTMMVTLEKVEGKSSTFILGIDFKSMLVIFSLAIAVISCTRGSLSSLKFFEL